MAFLDPTKDDFTTKIDPEELPSIAPDQFDLALETKQLEIWSYYSYYIGDNGLSLFNFGPTAFQNLLYQAAGDSEILHFLGSDRAVTSIVLLCNGLSFAIQSALFIVLGSFADFGTWRSSILLVSTIIAWAIGFGWIGVHEPSKWETATGLYIVGLIAYQVTITFWTAAFPSLARNTVDMRKAADELMSGAITRAEYDRLDALKRSEISNMAFFMQSIGSVFILAVIVGIMWALKVNDSVQNNNYGLSVLIAFVSSVWVLTALPWFVFEKRRPGQVVPEGKNLFTVGFWQIGQAMKEISNLKQSLLYLIGYFMLGDSLNTSVTVISTLQNQIVAYNSLQLTYLSLAGLGAQAISIYGFCIILLDAWGLVGIWTHKFGFHNLWEVWVYDIYYSAIICPWYSYSQIMISEVTPRGHEFLFFSLFSMVGKTSSFIGPLVSSAIIDATPSGNTSTPFYFLLCLSALGAVIIWFVDVEKSQIEQAEFLDRKAASLSVIEGHAVDSVLPKMDSENPKKSPDELI